MGYTVMMDIKPRKCCVVIDDNVILSLNKIVQGSRSYSSVSVYITAMACESGPLLHKKT